ncbi:hypothetical protein EON63_17675 [archaeon]|nr:MAG: hypothetical protein EON63_17675 [archaeon]
MSPPSTPISRSSGRPPPSISLRAGGREGGVQIEYYDDHGRKLTQKEAFRQLSYKFHGHQPGRKKREKRLKVGVIFASHVSLFILAINV